MTWALGLSGTSAADRLKAMHKGVAVSPGVAVGIAHRVESVFSPAEPQELPDPSLVADEVDRFDRAVALAASELEQIVTKVAEQLGAGESEIFKSHLTLVNDEALLERIRTLIQTRRFTALSALQIVLQDYAALFARSEHEYFRERLADLRDVASRIGSHLSLQAAGLNLGDGLGLHAANGPGPPARLMARPPRVPADRTPITATRSRSSSSPTRSCRARP